MQPSAPPQSATSRPARASQPAPDEPPAPAPRPPLPLPRRAPGWAPWAGGLAVALAAGVLAGYLWRGRVDDPPAATVNGVTIGTRALAHQAMIAAGVPTLQRMVNDELALEIAKTDDASPTPADVQAHYDKLAAAPGFAQQLAASGRTPDDVRAAVAVTLAKQNVIAKGVTATDAEARAFYAANSDPRNPTARYRRPELAQVAIIVTSDSARHALALHALASGAPFADVARAYSEDRSAAAGGVQPVIRRGSINAALLPGLESAVFALQPGQQIDTYKAQGKLWIIRCLGRQAGAVVPYDQVADECRTGAMLAKGLRVNGASIQQLQQAAQRDAKVVQYWPKYQILPPRS